MASHSRKLLRWSLELQQYNFNIVHRAGKDNLLAALLSRCPPRLPILRFQSELLVLLSACQI